MDLSQCRIIDLPKIADPRGAQNEVTPDNFRPGDRHRCIRRRKRATAPLGK
jgi:hypothetical protein